MKQNKVMQQIEHAHLKRDIPAFRIGDTLSIHTRIIEGEKERIQMFTGTVIARRGKGLSETVALYRVSYGAGMERVFLLHSPRIAKIEIVKSGKVRKSKLYYLRGTSGKAAKVKEQIGGNANAEEETVTSDQPPA
jgi:large subunit ribosomal protein L19